MLAEILLVFASGFAAPDGIAAGTRALWLEREDGRATRQAVELMQVMRAADEHGLRPEDYAIDVSAHEAESVVMGRANSQTQQRFEAAISSAAARFVHDLRYGRVDARLAGFDLPAPSAAFDAGAALRQLAASPNVPATIGSLEPAPQPYKRLKRVLAQYRYVARQPALTRLPALPKRSIGLGDHYQGASQLRLFLAAVGDLPMARPGNREDRTIDADLAAAIRSFQQRHGLDADGVIGARTFSALTTPLQERVRQIELSMERWRWLTGHHRPDIVVNIPQYTLFALPAPGNRFAEVLEMRVIVGRTYPGTRTPVFTSEITQVVFQPYWDVPRGILKRELLPRIRRDPSVLDRLELEIVRGQDDDAVVQRPTSNAIKALAEGTLRLRQRPGAHNALGQVKFVMPNGYNVYLHATPEPELFEQARRTFSHGCIRVSEPAALAAFVLQAGGEHWSDADIEAALCGSETLRVQLAQRVHVVVFYSTAVATASGALMFFPDVYGHDRRLQNLLQRAP